MGSPAMRTTKTGKVSMTITMTPDVYELLEDTCRMDRRNKSNAISWIIKQYAKRQNYSEREMNTPDNDEKELLCAFRKLDPVWRQCAIEQMRVLAQDESKLKEPVALCVIRPDPSVWGRTATV